MNPIQAPKLFQVIFAVGLKYTHPQYHWYDTKLNVLIIWLYGSDATDAAERAATILVQLPYEPTESEARVVVSDQTTEDADFKKAGAAAAKILGLALRLVAIPAGREESDLQENDR